MDSIKRKWVGAAMLAGAAGLVGGCSMMHNMMGGDEKMGGSNTQSVALSGGSEVPAVMTSATGSGTVTVNADHTVTARITVSGMTPTAAHIHEAAAGANGPVIVPFTKSGDDTFVAPPGAKLTDAQYDAFKAGRTYVNVHSAKSPSGEIRAQLKGN